MYKVIQVIQDFPLDEDNPFRGRHFLLFDEKANRKVDLRPLANKNQFTFFYEGQMFDIYGREIEIDPAITEVCQKIGRWKALCTDVETFLVKKSDGRQFIAYVEYYDKNGSILNWVSGLNPIFRDRANLKVRLVCSNLEVLDTHPFSEGSAIIQYYGDSDHELWLIEKPFGKKRVFFLLQPDLTRILEFEIFEKKTNEYSFATGRNYFSISYNKAGTITASSLTGREEFIIAETNEKFIAKMIETNRAHEYAIPFYLISKKDS